jgi:hypothetical protein
VATQATLTVVNALTKEIYQGKIREQLQNEIVGLKRITRSSSGVSSEVGGKYVTFPIRVSRNAGIGYRQEDEPLQNAGTQGYARVNIGLKYGYGRVKLTGQAMELAETNYQSFASTLDREMSGLKEDIAKDSARIFYGDGSGAWATITVVGTAGASATYTVNNPQYFFGQIGAVVDVVAPASNVATAGANGPAYVDPNSVNPALLNAPLYGVPATVVNTVPLIVTGLNVGAKTVTVTGVGGNAPAGTVGNVITRQGNYGREPYGLGALVGTQTLFNVDTSVYPVWQSVLNANAGTARPLSEGLMIKMTDDVRVNGGVTSLILTSLGVRRAYFNLLTQQRRYTNTKEFGGGMTGLAFNNGREIPVVEDVDAPPGIMYFLQESDYTVYRDKDWSWLDTDGGIWKWVQNKDAFEAINKQYWQIGLERRNSQGRLSDISEA